MSEQAVRPLLAANWKMNPGAPRTLRSWLEAPSMTLALPASWNWDVDAHSYVDK